MIQTINFNAFYNAFENINRGGHASDLPEGDEYEAIKALEHETTVLTFDGGILVREF